MQLVADSIHMKSDMLTGLVDDKDTSNNLPMNKDLQEESTLNQKKKSESKSRDKGVKSQIEKKPSSE